MKKNNKLGNNNHSQVPNKENQAATLALIASLISTFGGGLGTIATIVGIQEEEQRNRAELKVENEDISNVQRELHSMRKQITALEKELNEIKKLLSRLT